MNRIIVVGFTLELVEFSRLGYGIYQAKRYADNSHSQFVHEPDYLVGERKVPDTQLSRISKDNLLGAMQRFEGLLRRALGQSSLPHFSVEENLSPVHRSARLASRLFRPLAGWLLLTGLIFTLFNLQGAVSDLGSAFHSIRATSVTGRGHSGDEPNVHSAEQMVTDRMSDMAGSASRAFRYSFAFIVLALSSMVFATLLDLGARSTMVEFERWANDVYLFYLPRQLPATEGNTATLLKENIERMAQVIGTMSTTADQFGQLGPLVTALGSSTGTIESAMKQLPEHLRSSMSDVTSELISGLTSTLGESAEYTKRILAIYTEQELRVKGVAGAMNEIKAAIDAIQATHQLLSAIPAQQAVISKASTEMAASSAKLASASEQMITILGKLPVVELREASEAIRSNAISSDEMKNRLQLAHTALVQFIQDNQRTGKPIEDLSLATSRLITLLEGRISQSKAAYARSIQQHMMEALRSQHNEGHLPPELFSQLERQVRDLRFESIAFDQEDV